MTRVQAASAFALLALIPSAYADNTPTFDITGATVLVGPGSDNVFFPESQRSDLRVRSDLLQAATVPDLLPVSACGK